MTVQIRCNLYTAIRCLSVVNLSWQHNSDQPSKHTFIENKLAVIFTLTCSVYLSSNSTAIKVSKMYILQLNYYKLAVVPVLRTAWIGAVPIAPPFSHILRLRLDLEQNNTWVKVNPCAKFGPNRPSHLAAYKELRGWLRGTVVERRSLTGELSLSCTRPVADRWPMWVNRLL